MHAKRMISVVVLVSYLIAPAAAWSWSSLVQQRLFGGSRLPQKFVEPERPEWPSQYEVINVAPG